MRSVPVGIAVSRAGEILLDEIDVAEGGVFGIDPGIEHGNRDIGAGKLRSVRADRGDAPGLPSPPAGDRRDAFLGRCLADRRKKARSHDLGGGDEVRLLGELLQLLRG